MASANMFQPFLRFNGNANYNTIINNITIRFQPFLRFNDAAVGVAVGQKDDTFQPFLRFNEGGKTVLKKTMVTNRVSTLLEIQPVDSWPNCPTTKPDPFQPFLRFN